MFTWVKNNGGRSVRITSGTRSDGNSKRSRALLGHERLEERDVPATFYWIPTVDGGKWSVPGDWIVKNNLATQEPGPNDTVNGPIIGTIKVTQNFQMFRATNPAWFDVDAYGKIDQLLISGYGTINSDLAV
jgi:hypothetical protein